MRISQPGAAARDGTNGNSVSNYLIDGWQTDDPTTMAIEADSPDEQELIRFDNIFGVGAGKIPLGATILDAQLTYRTHIATPPATDTTSNSAGPWGVAALMQPFTTATRYADFPSSNGNPLLPSRGAWFQDGADQPIGHPYATRPVGAFAGPNIAASGSDPGQGTNTFGGITNADVFGVVQKWSDGLTNNGLVVQAGWTGQTNGWGFFTNGDATVSNHPKLSVTYTTSPIAKNIIQRGQNGYSSDTIIRMDSGANLVDPSDDVTQDGSTSSATGAYYIDGLTTNGGAFSSLMKFGNVFGSGAGQAPADKSVAKAWLVLTTGVGDDNRSPGPFSVHAMLRDFTSTSKYSDFGVTPGLQEADGDMGPSLDTYYGATNGQETWFDVTSYLEAARNSPTTDHGLAIVPETNDGWAIYLNNTTDITVRPRLVVYSDLSTTVGGIAGDYNNNGVVDMADYVLWRKGGPLQNDSTPGTDAGDYGVWRANFGSHAGSGSSLGGGAVPEPASCLLVVMASLAFSFTSSRTRSS